jgi:serine/threonine protein kinase
MKQILKGVEYLHKNRVVHRDIKAANLLVDIDGTIKLSDFGCARRYESDMQSGLLNSVRGSLLWMAPEVIKQSGYGRRADIWSLGCTLIELFTGKPPWNNFDNSISAMLRIGLSSDLPEVPEAISPEARDFIYACLQRDAHLRPTASHLLHHPFVN